MAESIPVGTVSLDELSINTLRTLAMDAVQQAQSGHPGAPMGLAPLGYVLWTRHLRHNPADPTWQGRDRFVLSCGHASMFLYGLLHLSGYDLSLDDIKAFRQLGSRTPGHPELGMTPGVETTTGPLGQGLANAVGMALAASHLAARFNRPGHALIGHRTYVVVSDGDLMEGISHEAASLAGHLRLGKLIAFYDDNRITIDGPTSLAYSDDAGQRFESYGWQVLHVDDGNDLDAIDEAIATAKTDPRPSLIVLRTEIAFGSPNKQGTSASHGAALGEEEVLLTKRKLDWPSTEPFHVPADALGEWRKSLARGAELQAAWTTSYAAYEKEFPEDAAELRRRMCGELPSDWQASLPVFAVSDGPVATRTASGAVLNALADVISELMGGSADLAGSVMTKLKTESDVGRGDHGGRNVYFGVREHAMGAVMNGMSLHGGVRPFGGTFLIFADYMRPAIRLAAMMKQNPIYLFSHDSIGLGEDGPTHQPIETLASLRAIHNLTVFRPADANETVVAWREAVRRTDGPTAIVLTRQKVPILDRELLGSAEGVARGGYVLAEASDGKPGLILLSSGSEISIVLAAREVLEEQGIATRVVSMASMEVFAAQPEAYRSEVLPLSVRRLAVEPAVAMPWWRWVGDTGDVVSLEQFGASAPYLQLYEHFGFTVQNVVDRAKALIEA